MHLHTVWAQTFPSSSIRKYVVCSVYCVVCTLHPLYIILVSGNLGVRIGNCIMLQPATKIGLLHSLTLWYFVQELSRFATTQFFFETAWYKPCGLENLRLNSSKVYSYKFWSKINYLSWERKKKLRETRARCVSGKCIGRYSSDFQKINLLKRLKTWRWLTVSFLGKISDPILPYAP